MISPRSGYESDPAKINWLEAYHDRAHCDYLAGSLVVFGLERCFSANIIKCLPELKEITSGVKNKLMPIEAAGRMLHPILMDWLIDEIRIGIFFENLMKAELLHKGYIIHTFKHKKLRKEQEGGPIPVSRLISEAITSTDLKENTIQMTLMFTPAYQQVIRTPLDILPIAERINKKRNKLHLSSEADGEMGPKLFAELDLLIAYANAIRQRL